MERNETGRKEQFRMTDVHMHVIPGVDDGSYTQSMSEMLLTLARAQGVRTVFATPHSFAFSCHPELVQENFRVLRESMSDSVHLFLGCEVRCELHSMQTTLERLKAGTLPSMNGMEYVLTEFSTTVQPEAALKITELLLADGWTPIIAHAERYPALFRHDEIDRLIEQGSLIQINVYSLEDETGGGAAARARKLLAEEKVSFLGSDAHRLDFRPPSVEEGLRYVYAHCSGDYADAVAFRNAEARLIQKPSGFRV